MSLRNRSELKLVIVIAGMNELGRWATGQPVAHCVERPVLNSLARLLHGNQRRNRECPIFKFEWPN
jgi:hypothetical protein